MDTKALTDGASYRRSVYRDAVCTDAACQYTEAFTLIQMHLSTRQVKVREVKQEGSPCR